MMTISNQNLDESTEIRYSLSAMKKAQAGRNTLIDVPPTPRALAARIELCKYLLREIANVQTSLALHEQDCRTLLRRIPYRRDGS
jgi:hypothetical protein